MRAYFDLDDDLLEAARRLAAESNRSLDRFVEDLLRSKIAPREPVKTDSNPRIIPCFGEGGLQPGVNLDSNAELEDLMDGLSETP